MSTQKKQNLIKALRPKPAAAYLGIGYSTFWRWVNEGRLPKGKQVSDRIFLWDIAILDDFLAKGA